MIRLLPILALLLLAPPAAAKEFVVVLDADAARATGLDRPANGIDPLRLADEVAGYVAEALATNREIRTVRIAGRREERLSGRERAELAHRRGADLYVRFCAKAGDASGFAVLSPDREGEYDGVRGPAAGVRGKSRLAAVAIVRNVKATLADRLPSRGPRGESETAAGRAHGATVEAIHSRMPTVLVELCCPENPVDAAYYRRPDRRRSTADGIARGIVDYQRFLKKTRGELKDELIEFYPVY